MPINSRHRPMPSRAARLVASAVLLACGVAGCGDDGFGRRYPVSGSVTFDGEPLPEGSITFTPEDPAGRVASGMIIDGSYRLTTVDREDGALPGRYKVSITADQADLSEAKAVAEAGGGAAMREDLVGKAPRTSLIPPRYNLSATSGLEAQVEERNNSFDFALVE